MKNWFVIYTKPRSEKKTAEILEREGFEVYCPVQKQLRQWSDRKKWVEMVVIPSYVFVKCEEQVRHQVLQQPGVLNFVYWLKKPAIVREEEMMALQQFLDNHHDDNIEVVSIRPGMTIEIESGALGGKSGKVVSVNKKQARIEIEGLGIALIATVKRSNIRISKSTSSE
ncbi:MAG: UpxY family transcription antiterminator [Cryomorphaceae bacterium]|nr:UpxY family transcription antiterminator [Cryomorphaceae bacterium]